MTYKQLARTTAAGLALAAAASWAAPSASAPDTIVNASIGVEAEIVQGLGFSLHSTPLSFGGVIVDSAGSCTVDATLPITSNISCTGATAVPGAGEGPSPASTFQVTGGTGLEFNITLPADNAVALSASGAPDMSLTDFTHNLVPPFVIGSNDTFSVGATVHFSATQPSGDYSATFFVGVAYN